MNSTLETIPLMPNIVKFLCCTARLYQWIFSYEQEPSRSLVKIFISPFAAKKAIWPNFVPLKSPSRVPNHGQQINNVHMLNASYFFIIIFMKFEYN